jgi:hypothetical protein
VSEDLIEEMIHFVREQLDEEERLAKVVADQEGSIWHAGDEFLSGTVGSDKANYILRAPYDGELSWEMRQYLADHDPARVLREVQFKRLILDDWQQLADANSSDPSDIAERAALWRTIRRLAASVRRKGCSAQDLLAAIREVVDRHPSARLVRNQVGNLAVIDGDEQVGALDLSFGRYQSYEES